MERRAEVTLSCTHAYCSACIGTWSSAHSACPLCRRDMGPVDDAWVLQEAPSPREVRARSAHPTPHTPTTRTSTHTYMYDTVGADHSALRRAQMSEDVHHLLRHIAEHDVAPP
jgi:hypothetical protein